MTPETQAAADRLAARLDRLPDSDALLVDKTDLRLLLAALDPANAEETIHHALHDLNVRIVGLAVGDCHCNLITQVILDALTPGGRK